MSLVPCSSCRRHVRLGENACPFCEAPPPSRKRAPGYVAFAIAGALAGCGEDVPPPPPPPVVAAPPVAPVAAPPVVTPPVVAEPAPPPEPIAPPAEPTPPVEVATPEPPAEEPAPRERTRVRRERPDERMISAYGGSPSPDDPF
jgi:hypothetical protein